MNTLDKGISLISGATKFIDTLEAAKRRVSLSVAAILINLLAVMALSVAAFFGLSIVMHPALAALCIAAALFVVAGILQLKLK